ncbi:hypothetical protein [Nostoc sp.]|uniref:hypothetical protein n=1 Tax=Nostoc sp. TaxID=1180 RepID=UPI002FF50D23
MPKRDFGAFARRAKAYVDDIDVEPIYLLKMTFINTGTIHALIVVPEIDSARIAICWVNWDIDAEKFSV